MMQSDRGHKNVGITLPPWAIEKLAALAKAKGMTKSAVIREMLAGADLPQGKGAKRKHEPASACSECFRPM